MKPDGKVGRPPVGPEVKIAFQPELLAMIDHYAVTDGTTRAAWVREACKAAVHARNSGCQWADCTAPFAATVTEEAPDGLRPAPRRLCGHHARMSLTLTDPGWTTTATWNDGLSETVTPLKRKERP